ncbi:MAG TPA: hypothetical protein VFX05_01845, partial [Casimicrobiaceae bacterium]|nr:hypothetical protein [Casimicrobiaceae bacterium]
MPERRATLLGFAIAASLAVVPVLVGVVLLVDAAQERRGAEAADSHVSVRQLAALKTFEAAIVRRDRAGATRPTLAVLADGVPQCAAEWRGTDRLVTRLRTLVGRDAGDTDAPGTLVADHLAAIDRAVAQFSSAANRRVADRVALDVDRWLAAARAALVAPVESTRYPGRRFHVRCADLAAAARLLARRDGRVLASLQWRGTEVERTVASWRPDQYVAITGRPLARDNPWAGLPGCVYLGRAGERSGAASFVSSGRGGTERVCAQARVHEGAEGGPSRPPSWLPGEPGQDTAPDDPRWRVPPSLPALLQSLDPLRRPSGALVRRYTATDDGGALAQRVSIDGAPVDIGFSVDLAIDPGLQALAQKVASCYTGRQDVCRALGVRRADDGADDVGHRMLERAMVRMAGVAIVDVASGRIEALAGALSPCARQEVDGPGRDPSCDARLPYPIRYRPDALLNQAVFHDAMPASIVKPVMAAAFLTTADVGPRWLAAERAALRPDVAPAAQSLRGELMRSDSARFLDRMFCADRGFGACERPWQVQAIASAFGWNDGCAQPSERCGVRDLLFGRAAPDEPGAPAAWVPFGRLLVEPEPQADAAFRMRKAVALDASRIARCAAGPDGRRRTRDDWEKCKGGMIVDVVAEGWGQGHARATALGVAGMMATLAAAANGQDQVPRPHLVAAIHAVDGADLPALRAALERWRAGGSEAHGLAREAAQVILDGMSYSHRGGTARSACAQVLGERACRSVAWIAGKTGTPTFPNDDRTLDELARLCAVPASARSRDEQAACGGLRPYKWYAAAYRSDPARRDWDKAIAVLTERNWVAGTGRVHAAG